MLACKYQLATLGTLLANVAHARNNPLVVAVAQINNLQEKGALSHGQRISTRCCGGGAAQRRILVLLVLRRIWYCAIIQT